MKTRADGDEMGALPGLDIVTRVVAASAGQDRCAVVQRDWGDLLLVADGAGGLAGGARAAESAIAQVAADFEGARAAARSPDEWCARLAEVDAALVREGHGGETTFVAVMIRDGWLVGASCGDSGALLIGADGAACWPTEPQHRKRLGSGRALPRGFSLPFAPACLVLLATDGLLKYADEAAIVACLRRGDLAASADALVELVRLSSGGLNDDVALVLAARASLAGSC